MIHLYNETWNLAFSTLNGNTGNICATKSMRHSQSRRPTDHAQNHKQIEYNPAVQSTMWWNDARETPSTKCSNQDTNYGSRKLETHPLYLVDFLSAIQKYVWTNASQPSLWKCCSRNSKWLTHHLKRSRDIEVTNVLLQIQPLSTSWGCLPHVAARERDVKVWNLHPIHENSTTRAKTSHDSLAHVFRPCSEQRSITMLNLLNTMPLMRETQK